MPACGVRISSPSRLKSSRSPPHQSLLAARIDRLAEREKQVLQTAAVLGKKFREAVLKRLIEFPDADVAASLSALQGAEFIYEEELYPEAEYAFKHPLTQEVAYASQLTERRRNTHAAAARAIVELYPDKQDEQAALLAHHWEEAGEPLEAARWHARAAGWVRAGDPAQSVRHWQRVHVLVEPLPETIILFNSGVRLVVEGSPVLEDLQDLCGRGVEILACGTCLGYYELKERIAVGEVSNMYTIAEVILGVGKVVSL